MNGNKPIGYAEVKLNTLTEILRELKGLRRDIKALIKVLAKEG